jgi:acetate kinase
VRRYGFHGLSYTFLLGELGRTAGETAAQGRIVLAHLGSGASLAAVQKGQCIDTTMGFTPAAGLPMGTRSGDLDPGLVGYLARSAGMSALDFDAMIHHESGLLGISQTSSDMRELLLHAKEDVRAAEAVEVFCYQTRKWIGAYAAALGGLDTLVFSGGVGENSPAVRARICAGLQFLGIDLEHRCNVQNAPRIGNPLSQVDVRVIATDEESVIAEAVSQLLWP